MSKAPGRLVRLESIRGFAAALVLLNHTRLLSGGPPGGVLGALGSLGQEAVILFFVLSGFVIHYASFGKTSFASAEPLRFRKYFIHRFRRIYPLLFISLALAYAVTCLGAGHRVPADWKTLGGNLIMLQDVGALKRGVWFEPYCGNLALWSLSYEWWFYMLFFAIATWMASRPETQNTASRRFRFSGLSPINCIRIRSV